MAIIRKNRVLIGYEQGVSVKSYKKQFQQTRARFFPLAKPKLSFIKKENTCASVVMPISKIPTDPGQGKYNLTIEDYSGQTLKIRACMEIQATSSLTISSAASWTNSINFKLIDDVRVVTFTCNTGSSAPSRTSEANYSFGTSGANTTTLLSQRIFDAINLAYEREELNIKPAFSIGTSIVNLEQVSYGNLGNTNITINNAVGKMVAANSGKFINGTYGIPRQENGNFISKTERKFHPKDETALALYTRGTENSKQLAFDINKIINNSGYNIKSKILQDDVLLIYQTIKGEAGLKYGNRASPETTLTQFNLSDQAKKYSFRFDNENTAGTPVGENTFYDLSVNDPSIPPQERYVDINLGNFYPLDYDRLVNGYRSGLSILYDDNVAHGQMFQGWISLDLINLIDPYDNNPNPVEVFKGIFSHPISKRVIDANRLDLAQHPTIVKLVIANNGPLWPEYELSIFKPAETGETEYQMTVNSYFTSIATRHPANLDDEIQEPTPGPREATRALRTVLLLDRIKLAFSSLSNTLGFIKFELIESTSASWHADVKYILRVRENKQLVSANMFFKRDRDNSANVSIIKAAKGSNSSARGYLNVVADISPRIPNSPRARGKITINHFSQYPPLDPRSRAIGSITILNSTDARWVTGTSFTLSGSNKSVKFSCDTTKAYLTHTKVDENNYTFGIQGRTSGLTSTGAGTNWIALSAQNVINEAHSAGDLDIYFPPTVPADRRAILGMRNSGRNEINSHKDKIMFRQNDYGLNSNMKIQVSDAASMSKEDFATTSSELPNLYLPKFSEPTSVSIKENINHDLEIRSFGLGENIDDISIFRDISFQEPHPDWKASYIGETRDLILSGTVQYELSGSKFTSLDVSPLYYLSAIDGEFPSGLRNVDSPPGYEFDGIIEAFPIREDILGSNVEYNLRGPKAALMGNYVYDSQRGNSSIVNNDITFNDSNIFPYYDRLEFLANEFSVGDGNQSIEPSEYSRARFEVDEFIQAVYSIARPSIIAIDGRSIKPFVDGEEKIVVAVQLLGNNPNEDIANGFVSEVFGLNYAHENPSTGESYKRRSGFDYASNPHPGTDSVVFGGLRYV